MSIVCSRCGWVDPALKIEQLTRDVNALRAQLAAAEARQRDDAEELRLLRLLLEKAKAGLRGTYEAIPTRAVHGLITEIDDTLRASRGEGAAG